MAVAPADVSTNTPFALPVNAIFPIVANNGVKLKTSWLTTNVASVTVAVANEPPAAPDIVIPASIAVAGEFSEYLVLPEDTAKTISEDFKYR